MKNRVKVNKFKIKRSYPLVLEFHRVLPEKLIEENNSYLIMETLISQEYFEQILSYLQNKGYQFVTISQLLDINDINKCVALTFDDGYSDNFEYAYPSLKKFNATATFFPVVSVCRDNRVLPLDIYYQIVEDMDLSANEKLAYYKGKIKKNFYWTSLEKQEDLLKELFSCIPKKRNISYMSADQLKKLSDEGFEIGSHSLTHSLLTAEYMSEQLIKEELQNSKQWLETVTGKYVNTFCFPAGRYNERLIELAKEAGYKSTCLVDRDNKLVEMLPSYKRINVIPGSLIQLKRSIHGFKREQSLFWGCYNKLKARLIS